jgi:hypothetical protein
MERLFSPCTRWRDIVESQGRLEDLRDSHLELLREFNLDVSIEELLSDARAFTYADLYAMLVSEDTVAWLTPDAAVARDSDRALFNSSLLHDEEDCENSFSFDVDGTEIFAVARSSAALSEIVDVVRRLVMANARNISQLTLENEGNIDGGDVFFNAPSLANLMEQCQSLKALSLENINLDENHCRVLGAISRPDLEIGLKDCQIVGAAATVLVDILGQNQGPTKLDRCKINDSVLADGLRGNSRLKSLSLQIYNDFEAGNQVVHAIPDALRENEGLVDLHLIHAVNMSDEAWFAVCDSLKAHPTLQVLSIRMRFYVAPLAPAVLKSRMQALVDMLKVNTSMHTIRLDSQYTNHELFQGSVIPYLVTNRLRPRVLAIQKTRPMAYRTKVLGRALLAVCTDVNSFWRLLSGNAEVAFPPRTMTIAAATNLPTCTTATDAATSTTNVADITASVMSTLTTTVTGNVPTATATAATSAATLSTISAAATNAAPPSTGQKRKVRP